MASRYRKPKLPSAWEQRQMQAEIGTLPPLPEDSILEHSFDCKCERCAAQYRKERGGR